MKARTSLLAVLTALSSQMFQNESTAATLASSSSPLGGITILQSYPGMPWLDYSKLPRLDYSRLPWLKPLARSRTDSVTSVEGLLTDLKSDIESAAAGVSSVGDSLQNDQQQAIITGEATSLAADYSALMSQDLSTLLSQDLSVNCGQLLSTSLAVPTAPPRPNWNRQAPVVARTSSGDVVVLPTYPPRTAWGNGGTVVTSPGGAVYTTVPPDSETKNLADADALRDVSRQLEVVQKDVERLQIFLENFNTNGSPPGLFIGPRNLKSGNAPQSQDSMKHSSDRLPPR
jgi:hypothetical protein